MIHPSLLSKHFVEKSAVRRVSQHRIAAALADPDIREHYRPRDGATIYESRTANLRIVQAASGRIMTVHKLRKKLSKRWRQLRRAVIQRDQFRCQNCFRKITDTTAHVHHTSYVGFRRLGKSFAFECVTLCANCHIEFHPHMSDIGGADE